MQVSPVLVWFTVPVMDRGTGPVIQRPGPGLLVEIDRAGELPLHEQIERALRARIRSGSLSSDTRLPSTRALAQELGVSRGVVTEAYGQLAAEGYLTITQGAPVRVARAVRTASPRAPARSLLESFPYHFHPGLPDLAGFPRETWLRSLRSALRDSPLAAVGYGDPRGVPELREALAEYLGRVRGVEADPEHMIVCTGFMQAFALICRTLRGRGVERIALEDPGWHVHRLIVENAGMEVIPVPVDEHGLRVDRTRRHRRGRRARDLRPSIPNRGRARPRAARGADRVGRGRAADHRGRLRRRVPLRPRRRRCAAGAGPRARRLHRLRQQAPGPRHAPGLAADAVLARVGADRGQGGRGRRIGGDRAARAV